MSCGNASNLSLKGRTKAEFVAKDVGQFEVGWLPDKVDRPRHCRIVRVFDRRQSRAIGSRIQVDGVGSMK